MNGYCQVYLYEDVDGGYTMHVAARKTPPGAPEHGFEVILEKGFEEYKKQEALYNQWRNSVEMVPLTHEYAGQTYLLCEIEEVIEMLKEMREAGVVFPDHVLTTLREEALDT
jgi:hypothetical protein